MRTSTIYASLALALLSPSFVMANPGASGGMAPSASAPSFDVAAEYQKGIAALKADRFAEAKKAFGRVLQVSPRDANANFLAGLASAGLNDLKQARKYFERAVKIDKKMVVAHQELGVTAAKLGDAPKAESERAMLQQMADKCAGTCPDAERLKTALAAVTAAIGAGPTAMIDTRPDAMFTSTESGDRLYLGAVSLINEGRYDAAIASLEAARPVFGPHPDVLTYLGFANRKLGRFAVAEDYYRQALAVDPDHKGATEYYGELMVERGDKAGATRMLARLDRLCSFGCAEADELRRWVEAGHSPAL